MSSHRSTVRRAAALVVILAAASGSAALRAGARHRTEAPAAAASVALPDTLAFEVEYAGVGAEGADQIWRGHVGGAAPGMVTIRMEYAGATGDRRMPVWPVNAWLLFSADDLRNSFAAELSGSMNWSSGDMRVTGMVSDGVRRDAAVEQWLHLHRPGYAGRASVRFLPRLAARAAGPSAMALDHSR